LAEAQDKVRKGKLNAAIVIPAGFGGAAAAALFSARNKPEIPIYYDPSQNAVLAIVKGMLAQQVMQVVSAEMFGGQSGANAASASNTSGGLSMPFSTKDEAMSSGPKYNGYAHAFAGMAVQFILFMGIDAGITILLARREGLWNRLLAAPITVTTVLVARALSSALIAFGLLCAIFAAAAILFKVEIAGSVFGFVGVGACFALMTATFGLLIAAYGKTPESARSLAIFATLIMVMLGGAWVPAFMFPQWLQTATLVVPTRWAVDGLDAVTWRGLPLDAALPAIGMQLGFAILFGGLALWKFRREGRAR
ncbi:MAG TPA: ABC transporter, partial [Oxalobacteraceae bacterium]|nr:ABC transporter [Oxalobacteraceae bacterium]